MTKTNRLALEKSPYLLQHQHNPVDWYPWGEEAFAAARAQNKAIFLSVGYSTCYWCHVMEQDSFERDEVAEVLNRCFISIKVDREERPDVDQLYMDVVAGLTGQGGWPMSVFLTPQLKPFWGGTFLYRGQFVEVLTKLHEVWESARDKVEGSAEQILVALTERAIHAPGTGFLDDQIVRTLAYFDQSFDDVGGGFGQAPKFPAACSIALLLRIYHWTRETSALHMAKYTLDRMARGGIYDHLAGGFSRYSTDESWTVPHFEKMLYDNALLCVTYLEAYQITADRFYAEVGRGILEYVLSEMTDPEGGFFSAQDAGPAGREGEYYVWQQAELRALLTAEEFSAAMQVYGVTAEGNFEHQANVLTFKEPYAWAKKDEPLLKSIQHKLLAARRTRAAPLTDDKIITAWNGLMISAMAKGHQVLQDPRYLVAAQRAAHFVEEKLFDGTRLQRRYCRGESRFGGCLDDYACLIEGLLALYQADFDVRWFDLAQKLQGIQDLHFWDEAGTGYFFSESADVLVRSKDLLDNATPSGNGISLNNLLKLFALSGEVAYRERAQQVARAVSEYAERYPPGIAKAIHGLKMLQGAGQEIAVVKGLREGEEASIMKSLQQRFLPDAVYALGPVALGLFNGRQAQGEKPRVYLCAGTVCREPVEDIEGLEKLLSCPQKVLS